MTGWDCTAWLYRLRGVGPWRRIHRAELAACRRLLDEVPPAGPVLDLGAGQGGARSLIPDEIPVIALDRSLAMLRAGHATSTLPIQGDALKLPFSSNTFQIVLAVGLSEYVADEAALLAEIARVTAPGGRLLYTVSPPSLWTAMRRLLGHRLWARRAGHSVQRAEQLGWRLAGQARTLMQAQMVWVRE